MVVVNKGKRAFIASFFFVLSLLLVADEGTAYRIGYEYSQAGRHTKAFEWMLKAANANHSAAQNNIGLSYLHGLGVKKDEKKAFFYFQKSASQGLPDAQSELAMLYYQQGNKQQAQDLWLLAAQQNDEYAQFNLASLFLEQNHIQQAYYWFNKALDNNHPDAQTALDKLEEAKIPQYKQGEKYVK